MKDGTCPKCGSTEVRTTRDDFGYRDGGAKIYLSTSMLTEGSPVDTYLCTGCGYYERFVVDADKLAQVAEKWPKASG
jgi:hypothetical protein